MCEARATSHSWVPNMAGLLSMSPYPRLPSSSRISLFLAASAASLGILVALRSVYGATQPPSPTVAESPRSTLIPKLSAEQASDLPYPPDVLPGSRDVPTPYGTIRVYEWGPEAGRRVLLVHGISTPCIALAGVAEGLVERGCRVMLFGELDARRLRGVVCCASFIVHRVSCVVHQVMSVINSESFLVTVSQLASVTNVTNPKGGCTSSQRPPHSLSVLVVFLGRSAHPIHLLLARHMLPSPSRPVAV